MGRGDAGLESMQLTPRRGVVAGGSFDISPPSDKKEAREVSRKLLARENLEEVEELLETLSDLLLDPPAAGEMEQRETGREPLPEGAPSLVGIFGKAQSGKDAAVDYLEGKYAGVYRLAFSDVVLLEANRILEGTGIALDQGNKALMPVRRFLQALGGARVAQDSMYWGRQVEERIQEAKDAGYRLVLVTGIRTKSDREMMSEIGASLWKVTRPGNPYKAEHSIEAEIDDLDFDIELLNDVEGDMTGLFQAARESLGD